MRALYEAGIGSILDYAAEDDLGAEADGAAMRSDGKGSAVARTFEYNTEVHHGPLRLPDCAEGAARRRALLLLRESALHFMLGLADLPGTACTVAAAYMGCTWCPSVPLLWDDEAQRRPGRRVPHICGQGCA